MSWTVKYANTNAFFSPLVYIFSCLYHPTAVHKLSMICCLMHLYQTLVFVSVWALNLQILLFIYDYWATSHVDLNLTQTQIFNSNMIAGDCVGWCVFGGLLYKCRNNKNYVTVIHLNNVILVSSDCSVSVCQGTQMEISLQLNLA